ncbi:MAG: hypothetical protein K6E78_03525, partial [Treponema sp.]|nr:hypothetical protein [Treponema sp.]
MKAKNSPILLLLMWTLLGFSACKNQSDEEAPSDQKSQEENLFQVTFNIDDKKKESVSIQEGQFLFKSLPEEPVKEGYKFLGWSFQHDNIYFNDLTFYRVYYPLNLYAVWLPEIQEICEVNFSGITLKTRLSNPDFYWVKAAYNLNNYYVTPFIKEEGDDYWSKMNLKYSQSSENSLTLTYSSGELDYTKKYECKVKAFNLEEEKDFSLFLSESDRITIKNLTTGDSFAKVEFSISGEEKETENEDSLQNEDIDVVLLDGQGNRLASRKAERDFTCGWYGLENQKSYSLLLLDQKRGIYKKSPLFTPEMQEKEKSDYLFLCYLAADNNLDPYISLNLKEMERSLADIYTEEGLLREGKASINIIVFFDGDDSGENNLLTKWSGVFKLGPDFTNFDDLNFSSRLENYPECLKKTWQDFYDNYRYILPEDSKKTADYKNHGVEYFVNFSPNTKNLSYTAAFLRQYIPLEESQEDSLVEMNSGIPYTLSNFLSWAKERFEGEKTFILISSHGSGPRAISVPEGRRDRAVTVDDGYNYSISSMNFALALKDAGFYGKDKADLIIFDSCYGSSLEDAYELKDKASYMIASPNFLPSMGLPYYSII